MIYWILFNACVVGMLALDLGFFHRDSHEVTTAEAIRSTIGWILAALVFNGGILVFRGSEPAAQFFTGYLIERALSIDNLFVFIMIFSYFNVPKNLQRNVLMWGIFGALVMRLVFILAGTAIMHRFEWSIYVFGGILIYSGMMMLKHKPTDDAHQNRLIQWVKRIIPATETYHGLRFFIRENGRRIATPLLLVLVIIELSDLIFAIDSIPAILAVTTDPFIVYTANVFAILGLRSMYFLVASLVDRFRYLNIGLSLILVLIGAKMLVSHFVKIPVTYTLVAITLIIAASVGASWVIPSNSK